MNHLVKIIALTALLTLWGNFAPRAADLSLGESMLPPIGHTRFCLQYPADCGVYGGNLALTGERFLELDAVNRRVNHTIAPATTPGDGASQLWIIAPAAGDCVDYAVTKRHELLAQGWPSRALLLAEVIVPDGEHHLVLVVRTLNVDLVLDNLTEDIEFTRTLDYRWVRIETPQNPKLWTAAFGG